MSLPETTSLLLEIGCEEIPARFLDGAERELGVRLEEALQNDARVLVESMPGAVKTYSTPRRLVVHVSPLLSRQQDIVNRVLGPSVKTAYDSEGKPTRAAEAFAAKHNVTVTSLGRLQQEKDERVYVDALQSGRETVEVLVELLPAVIRGLQFPKNMYWTAKAGPHFVRPIRWILALLGERENTQVVPFEFAGVKSGQSTFGHRLAGSDPIRVTGFNDYMKSLREHMVEPDPATRRKRAQDGLKALLEGAKLNAVSDDWLESWVVNSTECPVPLMGGFDSRYLALPREVLVTVMRGHQKYFAVEDAAGNLQPSFITMLNVEGDLKGLIRQGHERVLAARFADAEFFWNADQNIPLAQRIPMLERVTYQAKLGTYADKVRRMKALAEKICAELEQSGSMNAEERQHALGAVELCKCDLTTQMVQEFTELQGVIGGLYAKSQGEPAEVADAIYDHYRPVSVEDVCPRSAAGAVVSLADKFDSVVAGFSAGLETTGSSDPFGLRRAGNGIIKVAVEVLPGLDLLAILKIVVEMSLQLQRTGDVLGHLAGFLRERTEHYLQSYAGLRYDTVRAVVMSTGMTWSPPSQTLARGKALEKVRDREDFLSLAAAAKRARNILEKSATLKDWGHDNHVDESLLADGPERELYNSYRASMAALEDLERAGAFEEAFLLLAKLRPAVDRFFDSVMVMDNNPSIRANRLRLLGELRTRVFSRLADLSHVEGNIEAIK